MKKYRVVFYDFILKKYFQDTIEEKSFLDAIKKHLKNNYEEIRFENDDKIEYQIIIENSKTLEELKINMFDKYFIGIIK